jgi:hypothetical protein
MFETNPETLEDFIKSAARFDDVNSGDKSSAPILVLTRTDLLYLNVVVARTTIIRVLPALALARWIIFADPEKDAFFEGNAKALGKFIGEINQAPTWIWTAEETEYRYLVLTPDTNEIFVRPAASPSSQRQPRLRTGRSSTTLRAVQYEAIEASRRDSKP